MQIEVDCYAGYEGEQTPRSLVVGGRRVEVVEILDMWLAPEHRYFKVRGDDTATYLVRQDATSGEWELTLFETASAPKSPPGN